MPPKAKGKKATARKMPPPLPLGEVLTDGIRKQEWVIGTSIGKGGFGEIYMAALKGKDLKNAEHVIKIEPHENGPLFSELSYYRRVAKEEKINPWIKTMKLGYLAVPKYITSGKHDFKGVEYRFMVMERFGVDVEKHFRACPGGRFSDDTVSYLALRLLEALEFLHESEYVHADIKGSNLLTGMGLDASRVYLVDYGLAFRFNPDGSHKEYAEDPRRAHDGTVEFTSIDAHNGVYPARRSDLEILGYCLLQWACGKLPWEDNLTDKNYVASKKKEYKGNAGKLIKDCFGSGGSKPLQSYMAEVYKLGYTDVPSYSKLRKIFEDQLGARDPRKTLEWVAPAKPVKPVKPVKRKSDEGPSMPPPVVKRRRLSPIVIAPRGKLIAASLHKKTSTEGSDEVDLGVKNVAKKKRVKLDMPARADLLPEVVYPPELGYTNDKAAKWSKAEASSRIEKRAPAIRESGKPNQNKPKNPPPKESRAAAKANRKESPVRRSRRNAGKVINYYLNSSVSSLDESQGTVSFRESGEEEEEEEGSGRGKGKLQLQTTLASRKRRRNNS